VCFENAVLVNLDLASKYVYIVSNMAVLHEYVTLQFTYKLKKLNITFVKLKI